MPFLSPGSSRLKVFGATTIVIPLTEAYGPIAERLAEEYLIKQRHLKKRDSFCASTNEVNFEKFDIPTSVREEAFAHALKAVAELAKWTLLKHGFQPTKQPIPKAPQAICIHQPHHNKKEIMFSNFVFYLAFSSLTSSPIEPHIWTSDSDTLVHPTTVHRILTCLDAELHVGGATCGLGFHNSADSVMARIAAAVSAFSIKRGQSAVSDSVIVQPGACAAFRMQALERVLMRWYTGRNFGVKMVGFFLSLFKTLSFLLTQDKFAIKKL
jgi:hyaluronan synthase